MKSYKQLGVHGYAFFSRFVSLINHIHYYENSILPDLNHIPDNFYSDKVGWDAILEQTSGDNIFLWNCLGLKLVLGIKYKSARYIVRAIWDYFELNEEMTKEQIMNQVSKKNVVWKWADLPNLQTAGIPF